MKNKKLILIILVLVQFVSIISSGSNILVDVTTENRIKNLENPEISSCHYSWHQLWSEGSYQSGSDLALDSENNIYITGYTSGGSTSIDVVLLKYNSSGSLVWNRTWITGFSDEGLDVAVDSDDNVYVSGVITRPYKVMILLKYNSSGDLQWDRVFEPGTVGSAVATDSANNVYIGGRSDYELSLRKFNSSGDSQWIIHYGDSEVSYSCFGVTVDSQDNICITGREDTDFTTNVFVAKHNSSGTQLWNQTWGNSQSDIGYEISVDSSGSMYVTGRTSDNSLLLRYNSSGSLLWNRTFESVIAYDIAIDSSDNAFIVGDPYYSYQEDVFTILKYSPSGDLLLHCTWGVTGEEIGYGIILDSMNNIYLTGVYDRASAQGDIVLVKFDPVLSIIINSPTPNEIYEHISPNYNISIFESNLNTSWYTVNNGYNNIITQLTGIINETEWEKQNSGIVSIRFYANNSLGNLDYAEIIINKDIDKPEISILNPSQDDTYGNSAPEFLLSIVEPNLETLWYTIDNGLNNYTINLFGGVINQTAWGFAPYGNITINFYAKDLFGRIGFESINVIKVQQPNGSIPGYDILWLIGTISILTMFLRTRKKYLVSYDTTSS